MSIDRVLQLKLIADVSDINRKTGAVTSEVGKIRGAFSGLTSFVGPVMLNAGLQAASSLMDGLMGGFDAAQAYDRAFGELEANVGDGAAELASELDSLSFSLGFDDAETLAAFNELLTRTGSVDEAMAALEASFDLAAARGIELGAAAAEVGNIYKGEAEKLAEYGVHGETAKNSIDNVTAAIGHLGDEAETRAASIEGLGDRIGVAADRGFATAATWLTDLAENVLPKISALWAEFGPSVIEVATKFGEMAGKAVEFGVALTEKLEPVLKPLVEITFAQIETTLNTLTGIFDTMILLLEGDFSGAWESLRTTIEGVFSGLVNIVRGPLNAIIGLWNAIDFSIDMTIPNPAHGTIFDPVGTPNLVDLHTGDLIPDIPYLAKGGIVTRPTLAMIGEAGAEAVVPLERGMGMGRPIVVNINVDQTMDPAVVGKRVVDTIKRYEQRAGKAWRS